jgi:serine O-acetyltransferase
VIAITAIDVVVIYLIPLGAVLAIWLALALVIYGLALTRLEFDFKHDLRRKFEEKKKLSSGSGLRFSFPYIAKLLLGDSCIQAAFLYRVSRFCVRRRLHGIAQGLHSFSKFLTHVDVSPYADIGPGVFFYHGLGTVIGKGTQIGARALICQGVTTGGGPHIGDEVKLWAGAKIIGNVSIGDRAEIGANAVVLSDVPADCVAVGVPASCLMRKQAELAREPKPAIPA